MARPLASLISALALTGAGAGAAAAAGPADRYGPGPVPSPAPTPAPDVYASAGSFTPGGRETRRAPPPRLLSWPGKSEPAAAAANPPVQVAARPAIAAPAYARMTSPASSAPTAAAPPAAGPVLPAASQAAPVTPRFAPETAAPQGYASPLPYFAAPTPAAPAPASTTLSGPVASAAPPNPSQRARLYSVHRAYGMQPDPAPIPPQFFAQAADLSEPATPEPVPARAANAAARNAVNAARLAASDAN